MPHMNAFKERTVFGFFGCVRPDLAVLNLISDWLKPWVQRGCGV